MKLTFIPAPGWPCRVISADDAQPEESWSPQAGNKRIAAPTAQADASVLPAAPKPLPPGSCPHCPDRPLLFQARQQANYYRAMFRAAKQREAQKDARIARLGCDRRTGQG